MAESRMNPNISYTPLAVDAIPIRIVESSVGGLDSHVPKEYRRGQWLEPATLTPGDAYCDWGYYTETYPRIDEVEAREAYLTINVRWREKASDSNNRERVSFVEAQVRAFEPMILGRLLKKAFTFPMGDVPTEEIKIRSYLQARTQSFAWLKDVHSHLRRFYQLDLDEARLLSAIFRMEERTVKGALTTMTLEQCALYARLTESLPGADGNPIIAVDKARHAIRALQEKKFICEVSGEFHTFDFVHGRLVIERGMLRPVVYPPYTPS